MRGPLPFLGQVVPQPLHVVFDFAKVSLGRNLPTNPCSLRKGISKYKIKHKAYFLKSLTSALKDKR